MIPFPESWLQNLLDDSRQPGHIGRIPYLLILRWFILLGIVLRFILDWFKYGVRTFGQPVAIALSTAGALILALWLTFRPLNPQASSITRKASVVIMLDIAIVYVAYLSTGNLQSDFFLFFFLPLISATEYLPDPVIVLAFFTTSAASFGLIYRLQISDKSANMSMPEALLKVFLGREFLFWD